jgi:hypothetical protein
MFAVLHPPLHVVVQNLSVLFYHILPNDEILWEDVPLCFLLGYLHRVEMLSQLKLSINPRGSITSVSILNKVIWPIEIWIVVLTI